MILFYFKHTFSECKGSTMRLRVWNLQFGARSFELKLIQRHGHERRQFMAF